MKNSASASATSKVSPMSKNLLLVDREKPGISILTLNRPDKRNALSIELLNALRAAIEDAQQQPDQRVILLRGAGEAFCSGLDLKEAMDMEKAEEMAQAIARVLVALSSCPLVTIAAVHGGSVAGGAGIMTACDLAVAAEGTRIGYPETRRGLVAGLVMTFMLRVLNERHVRELLLTAELIDARRAAEIGLVNRVVPADELMETALGMAESVKLGAPQATAHTKRLLAMMSARTVAQDIQTAMNEHMSARRGPEAAEGIAAFMEKRAPNWKA